MNIQVSQKTEYSGESLPHFCLAQEIEFIQGPQPMLYVPQQERYVRLSAMGMNVLRAFEQKQSLTKQDLIEMIVARYPQQEEIIQQKVEAFLTQLENLGIVVAVGNIVSTVSPAPQKKEPFHILRLFSRYPMLRVPLWHPNRVVADGFLSKIRSRELTQTLKYLLGFWLFLAFMIACYNGFRLGTFINTTIINWGFVIVLFLVHILGHEFSHLLVAAYHKVKTRAIGFALLYYVLPVIYVDRTDSYRLQSLPARSSIALAGPAFDLSALTVTSMITLFMTGWLRSSLQVLFVLEVITFISNINPLMPSDGYQALESLFNGLNFRRRSFYTLFCLLTRTPLPPHLVDQPLKIKIFSCVYSVLSIGWLAVFLYVIVTFIRKGSY